MGFSWYWFSGHSSSEYLREKILAFPISVVLGASCGLLPFAFVIYGPKNKYTSDPNRFGVLEGLFFTSGLGFAVAFVGTCYTTGMAAALLAGSVVRFFE